MAMRIQVTFDCANPGKQAEFWAKALRYGPPDPSGDDDWAAIADPDRVGPRFYFQRVPEGKVAKNRVHLDLNASGGEACPSMRPRSASSPKSSDSRRSARTIAAARSRRTASSGSA